MGETVHRADVVGDLAPPRQSTKRKTHQDSVPRTTLEIKFE